GGGGVVDGEGVAAAAAPDVHEAGVRGVVLAGYGICAEQAIDQKETAADVLHRHVAANPVGRVIDVQGRQAGAGVADAYEPLNALRAAGVAEVDPVETPSAADIQRAAIRSAEHVDGGAARAGLDECTLWHLQDRRVEDVERVAAVAGSDEQLED